MTAQTPAPAAMAMAARVLRARELCLLGDYENGVPDFHRMLRELQRDTAVVATPAGRQIVQELQSEYAVMVQYQKSLQDLRAAAAGVPKARRRRQDSQSAWSELPAEMPEPPVRRVGVSAADSKGNGRKLAPIPMEQKVPSWAQPSVASRTRNATQTRANRTTASKGSSTSTRRRGKENAPKNAASASSRRNMGKSTAAEAMLSAVQRRQRPRVSMDRDDQLPQPIPVGDTIADRKRYSEVARENDWADQELIESVEREIVDRGERVSFKDIAGLDHTKQLLQEAVMLPQIAPHLFANGLLKHCSGILMFGPPGTGKTLLAKAVANECGLTFFNVSAATLSSKYRGDSEKLVRILFEMARYYAPSIIFMDEIDAIASARGAATEHEASRRVKTELMVQISGVASTEGDNASAHVMLLAATNLPWELDEAMRRRLTKRVYIPLPDKQARRALFGLNLGKVELASDVDVDELVNSTEGYSGDDITNVCETAKRMPVKRLYTPEVLSELSRRLMAAGPDANARGLEEERLVVTKEDFAEALRNVSKSVGRDQLKRFEAWETEFGSK